MMVCVCLCDGWCVSPGWNLDLDSQLVAFAVQRVRALSIDNSEQLLTVDWEVLLPSPGDLHDAAFRDLAQGVAAHRGSLGLGTGEAEVVGAIKARFRLLQVRVCACVCAWVCSCVRLHPVCVCAFVSDSGV